MAEGVWGTHGGGLHFNVYAEMNVSTFISTRSYEPEKRQNKGPNH